MQCFIITSITGAEKHTLYSEEMQLCFQSSRSQSKGNNNNKDSFYHAFVPLAIHYM